MNAELKMPKKIKLVLAVLCLILISIWSLLQFQDGRSDGRAFSTALLQNDLSPKQLDTIIDGLSQTLRQTPADSAARLGLAIAYEKKGWTEEAIKQYEQAIESSSQTLAQSYERLGQVLQGLNRQDEAARALQKATRIKSQSF